MSAKRLSHQAGVRDDNPVATRGMQDPQHTCGVSASGGPLPRDLGVSCAAVGCHPEWPVDHAALMGIHDSGAEWAMDSARAFAALVNSCLSGCFSRPHAVVWWRVRRFRKLCSNSSRSSRRRKLANSTWPHAVGPMFSCGRVVESNARTSW